MYDNLIKFLTNTAPIINSLRNETSIIFNGFDHENFDISAIAHALKHNKVVTSITFNTFNIDPEDIKIFFEALKENKTLASINFRRARTIGYLGLVTLAEVLKVNETLTNMNFGYGCANPDIGKASSEVLRKNKTLTHITFNDIYSEGMSFIANALKENKTLISIGFLGQALDNKSMKILAKAMEKNKTIVKIEMENMPESISKILARNQHLAGPAGFGPGLSFKGEEEDFSSEAPQVATINTHWSEEKKEKTISGLSAKTLQDTSKSKERK